MFGKVLFAAAASLYFATNPPVEVTGKPTGEGSFIIVPDDQMAGPAYRSKWDSLFEIDAVCYPASSPPASLVGHCAKPLLPAIEYDMSWCTGPCVMLDAKINGHELKVDRAGKVSTNTLTRDEEDWVVESLAAQAVSQFHPHR